jgi:hypothetical protein
MYPTCGQCGAEGTTHKHHDDYADRYCTRPLCARCHSKWHNQDVPDPGSLGYLPRAWFEPLPTGIDFWDLHKAAESLRDDTCPPFRPYLRATENDFYLEVCQPSSDDDSRRVMYKTYCRTEEEAYKQAGHYISRLMMLREYIRKILAERLLRE